MNPNTEDRLKRAFRDRQPAYVAAKLVDEDKPVELAPGKEKRSRWVPILRGLDGLSWLWVELRDVKGRMLGERLKNDEAPPEDSQELAMGGDAGAAAAAGAALIPAAAVGQLFLLSSRHAENLIDKNTTASKPAWDLMHKTAEHAVALAEHYRGEVERERKLRLAAENDRDKLVETVEKLVTAKQNNDEEGWKGTLTGVLKAIPHVPGIVAVLRQFGLIGSPAAASSQASGVRATSSAAAAAPAGPKAA